MSTPTNVETRGPSIEAVAIFFPILAAIFVALRTYTRLYVVRWFGVDDWVTVATLVVSIVYSVCIGIATHHGMGMHSADFTSDVEEQYYFWVLIGSEFYALGLLGYKVGVLHSHASVANIHRRQSCFCTFACSESVRSLSMPAGPSWPSIPDIF